MGTYQDIPESRWSVTQMVADFLTAYGDGGRRTVSWLQYPIVVGLGRSSGSNELGDEVMVSSEPHGEHGRVTSYSKGDVGTSWQEETAATATNNRSSSTKGEMEIKSKIKWR